MTYHRVCNNGNSGGTETFILPKQMFKWGSRYLIFDCQCSTLWIIICPFDLILLSVVLLVLRRITASNE